jgi:hypothetical protein
MSTPASWSDFAEIYRPLLDELERTEYILIHAQLAWQRAAESWQELTDYVNKNSEKGGKQ